MANNESNPMTFLQNGLDAKREGRPVDAHNWFGLAANGGNAEAMWQLACESTLDPKEVSTGDSTYWYEKAALLGHFPAIEALAHYYLTHYDYFSHDPRGRELATKYQVDYEERERWYQAGITWAEIGCRVDSLPCLKDMAQYADSSKDAVKKENAARKIIALTRDRDSYEFAVKYLWHAFILQKREKEKHYCAMLLALLHDSVVLLSSYHTALPINEYEALKRDVQNLTIHF